MSAGDRNEAARGSRLPRFLVACALALAVPVGAPAGDEFIERDDIDVAVSEIVDIVADMDGRIAAAASALSEVQSMSFEETDAVTELFYAGLKDAVNGALDKLSPNSILMDNLDGAKINTIVLRAWFERQSPDYPNRNDLIARLEEVIRGYDEVGNSIAYQRQEAQEALRQLALAQFYQRMESKVETTERSLDIARGVVQSLKTLSGKLRELAELEVPEAIPN